MRILIVEDEIKLSEALSQILTRNRYMTDVANDGESGLDMALDCMADFGRVALLGCTRNKDFSIDYYRKVHCPGITLIGAHTRARPTNESHPGYCTHRDDIAAVFNLLVGGRLSFESMGAEMHSPHECPAVYERLINDKNFPAVVQFDWERL